MSKFPINGRVWYPAGDGPFPLVLIVHGNHDPLDYSDPGYGYLGELLASRGFILVSVDENFINGGLRGESDGRAWLLLKHLEDWKRWNDSTGGPFYHKVDMNNIGIMGHSRGGEAVGIAAAFNRLSHYPDDANVKFNFNFNIKAVFAIAPVDGQYKPAGVFTPIENVNYMVIHGSHDGDVSSFNGLRAFQRIRSPTASRGSKRRGTSTAPTTASGTPCGATRTTARAAADTSTCAGLITQDEQRQFSKVVIGAFLEATLHGKTEYLPMFRDHRVAGRVAAEDDVHHALSGERVQTARHVRRGRRRDHGLGAGRDDQRRQPGDVEGESAEPAQRQRSAQHQRRHARLEQPHSRRRHDEARQAGVVHRLAQRFADVGAGRERVRRDLSLARADRREAGPARAGARHDEEGRQHQEGRQAKPPAKKPDAKPAKDTTPVDLTIEVVDAAGHSARLPITRFGVPRRPLESTFCAARDEEQQRYPDAVRARAADLRHASRRTS